MTPFRKRLIYAWLLSAVPMGLLLLIDWAFDLGLIEFLAFPGIFLLVILFWFIAPWMSKVLPYDNVIPIYKRLGYTIGMIAVTSMLLVPIDLAFLNWGLFEFFCSPRIFLLLIPFWFIAPWMSKALPYDNSNDDDDH